MQPLETPLQNVSNLTLNSLIQISTVHSLGILNPLSKFLKNFQTTYKQSIEAEFNSYIVLIPN